MKKWEYLVISSRQVEGGGWFYSTVKFGESRGGLNQSALIDLKAGSTFDQVIDRKQYYYVVHRQESDTLIELDLAVGDIKTIAGKQVAHCRFDGRLFQFGFEG